MVAGRLPRRDAIIDLVLSLQVEPIVGLWPCLYLRIATGKQDANQRRALSAYRGEDCPKALGAIILPPIGLEPIRIAS